MARAGWPPGRGAPRRRPPVAAAAASGLPVGLSAPRPQVPASKSLRIVLSAVSPPAGSGSATVEIFARQRAVCWTFGRLAGVVDPSEAAIGIGDVGGGGSLAFALGDRYSTTGCVKPPITRTGLRSMVKMPGNFFVVISTGHGAATAPRLRGQLAPGRPVGAAPFY